MAADTAPDRSSTGPHTASDVIEITQVRSAIGAKRAQQGTLRALGLRRIRHTVTHADRPEVRGMVAKVAHLIEVRRPGDDTPMALEPGQELDDSTEPQR